MQFLQYNELNGSQNLKEWRNLLPNSEFENTLLNLSKWNTFALDLSKIITPEPGAIYRVSLFTRKKYSLYKCETMMKTTEEEEEVDENDVNYSGNSYDDYYMITNGEKVRILARVLFL
jgi:hypothetical protein